MISTKCCELRHHQNSTFEHGKTSKANAIKTWMTFAFGIILLKCVVVWLLMLNQLVQSALELKPNGCANNFAMWRCVYIPNTYTFCIGSCYLIHSFSFLFFAAEWSVLAGNSRIEHMHRQQRCEFRKHQRMNKWHTSQMKTIKKIIDKNPRSGWVSAREKFE